MVAAENPRKPLSDNAIANLLKDEGLMWRAERWRNIVNRYILHHRLREKS